jgi:hypothetical protein
MYLLVSADADAPSLSLQEPDDCKRFHLTARGAGEDAVSAALAGAGRLDGTDHAWIGVEAVRRMAAGQVEPDWSDRFEAMLRFAAGRGWLSADGAEIQAHCVWE